MTIIILAIVLAAALGYGAYAWWQNDSLSKNVAERDSKNASLQQENTSLKDQLSKTQGERDELAKKEVTVPATPTDQEAVETAAKNFADAASDGSTVNKVSQIKINGNFAEAVISSQGPGGFGVTLKKVNNAWVVIYDGQNAPDQETVKRFGIPQ